MSNQELKEFIKSIEKIPNQEWIAGLEERKLKELEFHDRDRDRNLKENLDKDTFDKFYGNKKFYSTVQKSTDYTDKWLRENAPGKVFLDYACGEGNNAIKARKYGASLSIGFDISNVSVENAKERVKNENIDNVIFFQADAENCRLPNDSVDLIICSGMLHHLDLSYAFPELRRILKPGGKILCVEALDYNPIIKLYRLLTPDMRTDWEKAHILSLKDVNFAKRFFTVQNIKYWHITSYIGAYARFLIIPLNFIDSILTKIPGVRLMSWIFTFELKK